MTDDEDIPWGDDNDGPPSLAMGLMNIGMCEDCASRLASSIDADAMVPEPQVRRRPPSMGASIFKLWLKPNAAPCLCRFQEQLDRTRARTCSWEAPRHVTVRGVHDAAGMKSRNDAARIFSFEVFKTTNFISRRPVMEDVHPLAGIIVQAFAEKPRHDGTSLAPYLFGTAALRPRPKEFRHYRHVAEHALEIMHRAGLVVRDGHGWFLLRKQNVQPMGRS
jgi:hypothetical protein